MVLGKQFASTNKTIIPTITIVVHMTALLSHLNILIMIICHNLIGHKDNILVAGNDA